jgi:acyl-CoA thioester hydrolase
MADNITVRVRYAETDAMGYVYYAKYLEYFEMGRTEFIRKRGKSYQEIEREGFMLPVSEVWAKYRKPARYDEVLTIETAVSEVRRASIEFSYRIKSQTGALLTEGKTKHAFMSREGRIIPIPEVLRKKLLTI